MPPAILLALCMISCKTGMSVFCHGRQANSPDLNPIEHIWDLLDWRVRAIPPRSVQELAGALVEEWGNISQQELSNLVQSVRSRCTAVLNAAGGHTRYWLLLLILIPLFQGLIILFLLVTCLWNLFSLCLLLNLMFIQIFTHVKFAENKHIWQWEDVSFFAEFILTHYYHVHLLSMLYHKLLSFALNRLQPFHCIYLAYLFYQ